MHLNFKNNSHLFKGKKLKEIIKYIFKLINWMYPNKNEIKSLHSLFGTLEIEKKKEISSKLENFISKKKI